MVAGNENSLEVVHPAAEADGGHTGICDTVKKFEGLGEDQGYISVLIIAVH